MARPTADTAHPQRDEWEVHRRELFRLFIVEGVSVAEIAEYMRREHRFDKKPKDYEYRFKKWNLRRNLHEKELRSFHCLLKRRSQAGRASEVVVSGKRWSESMIVGRLDRHKAACISTNQIDINALPDFLARVQTPSPLMSAIPEWPRELPWLQFSRYLRQAPAPLTFKTVARPLHDSHGNQTQGQETLLVQMMHPYLASKPRRSNHLGLNSLHPTQKMRAVLEVVAPQVYDGDHETTAEILHTGSQESIAIELVRLLIYLETNNMIPRLKEIIGFNVDLSLPANMLEFLRRMGFLTKANIAWLGNSVNPTNQVFLERLLDHSIVDETSFDVLGWLIPGHFDVNHPVQISSHYWVELPTQYHSGGGHIESPTTRCSRTMLQASSLAGNIHAVRLLLDLDADPYENGGQRTYSPIECAASLGHHDRATMIAHSLLSKPTRYSSECQKTSLEGALQLAIARANTKLILKLLVELKRIGHGTISSQHLIIAAGRADCDTIRLLVDYASLGNDGLFTLPKDILFSAISESNPGHELDLLLGKVNCLLDLGANPAASRCGRGCGKGFILDYVIGFSARFEDQQIGEDFALSLAETMRKYGCPPERPKPTWGVDYEPSALQAAIYLGYPLLVEYLLDWGIDIDHYHRNVDSAASACEECNLDTEDWFEYLEGRSPLLTALEHRETEIAKMLLRWNPNLKLRGGEQRLAMKGSDDTELLTMLLQAGSINIDGWEDCLEQAILWRNPKSTRMLLSMDIDGYGIIDTGTILRAALITGDHDWACQLVTICDYDSHGLFEAVLQSHRCKDYHKIVERLLNTRQPMRNDDFEIRAVASAAIHQDMYLLGVLTECFGQGPWIAHFPRVRQGHDEYLSRWVPEASQPGTPMHILNYAAKLDNYHEGATVVETLLAFGLPANGMYLEISDNLTPETWRQLIAAGADPNLRGPLHFSVKNNMLAYVEVLCEAKVLLNTMQSVNITDKSRTAVQVAVESGSPKVLQMLLNYGADVEYPAGYYRGATCLQLAAGAGNIGLIRLLLNKGARVNSKRSLFHGRTAIEAAAEHGRLDVLKLFLLQEYCLFQTAAERYQFIRAAKLAEMNGRACIVEMLKQHIDWDRKDQRLFDEIQGSNHLIIHLDEMTQRLLDSDRRDPDFWTDVHATSRKAGFEHVYDIEGIEQWIVERAEEETPDWITAGTDWSAGCRGNRPADSACSTSLPSTAIQETTVPPAGPRSQAELQLDVHHTGEIFPAYEDFHDDFDDPTDIHGDRIGKDPNWQCHAWMMDSEVWEETYDYMWATQVTDHANQETWEPNEQDNDADSMIKQVNYNQGAEGGIWQGLMHWTAAQNVSQESATLLGKDSKLDEVKNINKVCDGAIDHASMEDISETDHSHVQHFHWGFWDDESFALHSGQLGFW